jgi:hypothetical protein
MFLQDVFLSLHLGCKVVNVCVLICCIKCIFDLLQQMHFLFHAANVSLISCSRWVFDFLQQMGLSFPAENASFISCSKCIFDLLQGFVISPIAMSF